MKILVTGGAGYIGSTLVEKLLQEGHDVTSVDNNSRGSYTHLAGLKGTSNFKMFVADICNINQLEKIMKSREIDVIVHAAAIPGLERCRKKPKDAVLTNIYGTLNVLEIGRKYDVDRVILTSSAAVYGIPVKTPVSEDHPLNPRNLYGATKLSAEILMKVYYQTYGLSTVILRFGNVYGVGLYTYWETVIPRFVMQALSSQPLTIYGNGEQSRDFIHVYDITKAIILSLNASKARVDGEIFNVGTGKPTKINYLANLVSEIVENITGKQVRKVHLPPRKGEPDIPDFCLSPIKIQERLKFCTTWRLNDGIKQLVNYWLKVNNPQLS